MSDLRFLMIVDNEAIARYSVDHGVDRLFVDLERLGKDERQKNLNTWISRQGPQDVTKIREAAPDACLLVRTNPLNPNSRGEIDDVIARGADVLMLPMFHTLQELESFAEIVAGRALTVGLFETVGSVRELESTTGRLPVDEAHFGLNDLHLELRARFMFEPLADGFLDHACARLRSTGTPFGIGGVARAGEGQLPPEVLLGAHARLGSTAAILSRTFHRDARTLDELLQNVDLAVEVERLRGIYRRFLQMPSDDLEANRAEMLAIVRDLTRSATATQ